MDGMAPPRPRRQIELAGVRKSFPGRAGAAPLQVLDGIGFGIGAGEIVGLLGPSGCGKSTVLNIIAGLDDRYEGEVSIQGRPVADQLAAGFRVAYVFQESRLLPWLTVRRNVEFVLRANGFARSEWRARTDRVLELVELSGFAEYFPQQLSGGMQQRASIARAFAIEPDILLMDEPFSALDELTARRLRESLLTIWDAFRTTILFVSHNAFESAFMADRVLIMGRGRGGVIHEEMDLSAVPRPRSYESTALFEKSREVVQALRRHSGRDEA